MAVVTPQSLLRSLPLRKLPDAAPTSPRGAVLRRWGPAAGECVVAVLTGLGFAYWSGSILDDPIRRAGQVSGLAALQLRLALVALPLLAAVVLTTVWGSARLRRLVVRLACAAVAGLATGFLAGGQVFALRGTPWPINAENGDNGALILFAREVMATGSTHSFYPPGVPYVLAYAADHFTQGDPALALKPLLIVLLALTGPAAYLAWRLCLRPLPALAVALVSVLPQTMPYKSYSPLVLVVLVPLAAKLLMWLRASPTYSARGAVLRGAFLGLVLGVLFLVYSGWHVWAAPGLAAAVLVVFPWRRGRSGRARGGLLLAGAAAAFLVVGGRYLWVLLHATNVKDTWCSQITLTQPAYIGPLPFASSAWDQPGEWPPLGEFAGLGLFTVVLLLGLGTAVALGLRRPIVIAPLAIFSSAWLMRFWIAHHLQRDEATQLFPRTANVIQVCLCVLAVLAGVLVAERARPVFRALAEGVPGSLSATVAGPRFTAAGVLLVLVLAAGMAGSALTDQYLPERASLHTGGSLTWFAHQQRKPDGSCPRYADGGKCHDAPQARPLPAHADYATASTTPTFLQDCEYPWRKAGATSGR